MFKWFRGSAGLDEVEQVFVGMLADDARLFELASRARLGDEDVDALQRELLPIEEQTDEAERRIRRLILVHASVHGGGDIAACLMYMSIIKDAERVGDLARNLFGIARDAAALPDVLRDEITELYGQVGPMIGQAAEIFVADDTAAAYDFIERARALQARFRTAIDALVTETSAAPQPAATVLTYRHLGRIVANLVNIVSSVTMPLDQLDYPRPDRDTH